MKSNIMFYDKKEDSIRCKLCPHNCILKENKFGVCNVRTVENNIGIAINYGEVTSANIDPIEKKPLCHYKPGKNILSVGTFGCNMSCSFCQNYEISQQVQKSEYIETDKLINIIETLNDNIGIAFTYNEPFMWYEYIYDVVKKIKGRNKDISTVLVTNGYVNKKPLEKILPYIDAMNIDLKGYTNKYYNNICGAKLEPVLDTLALASMYCHIEITTLMVRGENDSIDEIENIAKFIASVDKNIPLHLSRYFPRYNLNNPPTDIESIIKARDIAKRYLNYVYIGNVAGVDNNTYCPDCNEKLLTRGIYTTTVHIDDNKCDNCGKDINIVL